MAEELASGVRTGKVAAVKTILFSTLLLLGAASLPAAIQSKTVEYQSGDVTLEGVLVWDDAVKSPQPGVLVVHQWWSSLLKEHGGKVLLEHLSSLDLTGRSESVQESPRQLLGDVRHNLHRMDYPTYVKNGWPIGSGVIESACQRVIARRQKAPGRRWRERGTHAVAHARSLYFSSDHRWQFFWTHLASG